MVTNETQAESVLYGDLGAVAGTFLKQNVYIKVKMLTLFLFFYSLTIRSIYHPIFYSIPCICEPTGATLTRYGLYKSINIYTFSYANS
jgi:hypothetical protein